MAKSEEKLQALHLRREGHSIREIARTLGVSRGSVSTWVRDIELTDTQRKELDSRVAPGRRAGRATGTESNRARRIERLAVAESESIEHFKSLSLEELLLIGLGLYWGEGAKKGRTLLMTNSDPVVMKLMVRWFKECFGIEGWRLWPRIFISDIHRDREQVLIQYWSEQLHIPVSQFRKTVFLNKGKKLYENRDTYYGVLALYVSRGTDLQSKILAHIARIGLLATQAGVVQELERGTHKP